MRDSGFNLLNAGLQIVAIADEQANIAAFEITRDPRFQQHFNDGLIAILDNAPVINAQLSETSITPRARASWHSIRATPAAGEEGRRASDYGRILAARSLTGEVRANDSDVNRLVLAKLIITGQIAVPGFVRKYDALWRSPYHYVAGLEVTDYEAIGFYGVGATTAYVFSAHAGKMFNDTWRESVSREGSGYRLRLVEDSFRSHARIIAGHIYNLFFSGSAPRPRSELAGQQLQLDGKGLT